MKKWYVITGILALLCIVSLGTCLGQSSRVSELEVELFDVKGRLADVSAELVVAKQDLGRAEAELETKVVELASAQSELTDVRDELSDVQKDLDSAVSQLAQLKATGEIVFGKGLRVFEVSLPKGYWGSVSGKVQNISSEPMELVYIAVVAYGEDGSLKDVSLAKVYDLFPDEVADWNCYPEGAASYGLYAFGNKR